MAKRAAKVEVKAAPARKPGTAYAESRKSGPHHVYTTVRVTKHERKG